jgi:dihydroorotate dehydrogenase
MPLPVPTYDTARTYDENYERGPAYDGPVPAHVLPKRPCAFLGFRLNSPLGVPAGPLLNSAYVDLYGRLGWDVPVYKTVRSVARSCHPAPNCLFVAPDGLTEEDALSTRTARPAPQNVTDLAITNSFGMPSKAPDEWMTDVQAADAAMGEGQVLIVSIVGTPGAGGRDLAADFAYTAALAKEAGARVIEANFSCPNVVSGEGSLYGDPDFSAAVTSRIRREIGDTPLLIKIGALPLARLRGVVQANVANIDGIAAINTVPLRIVDNAGRQALPGEGRLQSGVCGAAIRNVAAEMTARLVQIRKELDAHFAVVSVGGVMTERDIDSRLALGADLVMSATAAMWDPLLAGRWRSGVSG